MNNYTALIRELKRFIIGEADNERSRLHRQWSLTLNERVASGKAIIGLNVIDILLNGDIHLRCSTNNSRFREGDFLVLHRGTPFDQRKIQVSLNEDNETDLVVYFDGWGDINLLIEQPTGWIADEGMLDLSDLYIEAIDELSDSKRGRDIILPLLTNDLQPYLEFQLYENGFQKGIEASLNESQAEALAAGYSTNLVHLIQGPPGTGKTYVLAHLVREMVMDGLRVFVTALTHRAINNALNKIYSLDTNLPVCKIGRFERAKDLNVENYPDFLSSRFLGSNFGYAIGATPFVTRTRRLGNVDFDVVIFDEASQVTLPLAIMGMLPAEKYIFIGDQHQLPPVTLSKSSELSKYSIFKYLCDRGYETMLTTSYRLNQELTVWPNKSFYNGQLISDISAANRRFKFSNENSKWKEVLSATHSMVFIDLGHRKTTTMSPEEATIACEIICEILDSGISSNEIGVVVPYRSQARLIKNKIRKRVNSTDNLKNLVIDTVERMQGQEREIILVSLTTSSAGFASDLAEFFFQPQRLNVSVTRQRTKLIILGSRNVLGATCDDPQIQKSIDLFNDLISTCKHIELDNKH